MTKSNDEQIFKVGPFVFTYLKDFKNLKNKDWLMYRKGNYVYECDRLIGRLYWCVEKNKI